jgi:hypothetical protein
VTKAANEAADAAAYLAAFMPQKSTRLLRRRAYTLKILDISDAYRTIDASG